MTDYEKLLKEDIEQIYLGNLSTVEADIDLPLKGKNGSVFSWKSSDERRLSGEGKVYRPPFTGGNRKVVLTLTATLGNAVQTRQYTANILEMEYPFRITKAYDVELYIKKGEEVTLTYELVDFN